MIVPDGVKVYGPGRIRAKAGQELPQALKTQKVEAAIKKAGEKSSAPVEVVEKKEKASIFDKKKEEKE
jgi:hypothetical protein